MKHKTIIMIFAFIIIELSALFIIQYQKNVRIEDYCKNSLTQQKMNFNAMVASFEKLFTHTFYDMVNSHEILVNMYSAEYATEKTKAEARHSLYRMMEPVYKNLRRVGIEQMHFHLPDGSSFLRMHEPDIFDDNLTGSRYSVTLANTDKKFVKGFETGRTGGSYRFVFPLYFFGTHVGSVELGLSVSALRSFLTSIYGNYYYFMIPSDTLRENLFPNELNRYEPSYISEKFSHEKTESIPDQSAKEAFPEDFNFRTLNKLLTHQAEKQLNKKKDFYTVNKPGGTYYVNYFLSLTNAKGTQTAFLVIYTQDRNIERIVNYYNLTTAGVGFTIFVIMLFLYKNAEERRIIKKINESLEAKVQAQVEEIRSKDLMMSQKAKMASMGELLGAIAHQWKQPLSTISLIAQYIEGELEKQPLEKDEGAELTGVLKEQADFMNATINDFLNFLKPGSDPVVFDVSKAISDMTEMFKFLFSINNITINISACGHYGFLTEGYLNEFKHVVFNLLNNSKDAISSRKIRDAELQGKIEIKISSNLTDITIEITDNGGGIPDNIINSVFEQYFSTKGEKGTGIGLYMAKNLIEKLMSGRINVANVKDGACFRIDLKRYSE